MRRKGWAVAPVAILLIVGAIGIAWLNPQLTHYVESDRFRAELEKETAKGLHFSDGRYARIHRKGFLTAASDRFQAGNGRQVLRTIDAMASPVGLIHGEYSSGAGSSTTSISIQAKSKSKPTRPAPSRARPNPGSTFSSRGAFTLSKSKRIRPM